MLSFSYVFPFIARLLTARAYPTLTRLPHWLMRADASLLHRLWNQVNKLLRVFHAPAFGNIPPGVCNVVRTGMDIPFMCVVEVFDPLDMRVWWVRAALAVVLIVPGQLVVACACTGHEGVESLCTRQAWGTLTLTSEVAAFFAPRVAMLFAVNAAIWWLSAHARSGRARSGDMSKQE
jgi:hypothetical protein